MVTELKSIRSLFPAARNQGSRPTCLAFAASDAHAAVRDGAPLSCEYLFYKAQKRAGRPFDKGALLGAIVHALSDDGQPHEVGWPYSLKAPAGDADWVPPGDVGQCFARDGVALFPTFDEILAEVEAGKPYVLLIRMANSFYYPAPGGVIRPDVNEVADPNGGHAVVAVGHGVEDTTRYLLVRNSWSDTWGDKGYGWVPETYFDKWLYAAARLGEEKHVHSGRVAT